MSDISARVTGHGHLHVLLYLNKIYDWFTSPRRQMKNSLLIIYISMEFIHPCRHRSHTICTMYSRSKQTWTKQGSDSDGRWGMQWNAFLWSSKPKQGRHAMQLGHILLQALRLNITWSPPFGRRRKKYAGVGPIPLMILFSPAQQVFVSHLVGARRGLRYCLVILRHVLLLMLH